MRIVWALICLTLLAIAPASRAADYPTRPIRLVVPYVAGGPTDVLGRMVADYLTRDLKQSVVIENKGGAQGAIGAELVAHADPDGYTLLFTASSVLELNPILYKKLSYDPDRELQVIAIVVRFAVGHGRSSLGSREDHSRVRGLCPPKRRQGQFRFGRHRWRRASLRRDAQADGRHRDDPRALQGRRPRAGRSDLGSHPG